MQKNKPFLIKIKNFQSLSEANLELTDGLTIVTGATNNGKSAIIRAVESAIFNDGIDEYIKVGTDGLSVTLDNGEHTVEYNRKSKGRTEKTTYQFDDGEVQQKVGRMQLPEMENFFNIREVRLQNNQRARLNFWYQNDQPFLMDKSPGQLYEFLSISSSEKYLTVLKAMSTEMKQEESDIKNLTISIDTLKCELSLKQDLLDRNKKFYSLYDTISVLKKDQEHICKAESLLMSMNDLRRRSEALTESLQRVKTHIDAIPMENIVLEMKKITKESESICSLNKQLADTEHTVEKLRYAQEKFSVVSSISERSTERLENLHDRIEAITKMAADVSDILQKEQEVHQYNAYIKIYNARLATLPVLILSTIQQATLSNRINALEKDELWLLNRRKEVSAVMSVVSRIKEAQDTLQEVIRKLEESDNELDDFRNEIDVCPFCGSAFCEDYAVSKL